MLALLLRRESMHFVIVLVHRSGFKLRKTPRGAVMTPHPHNQPQGRPTFRLPNVAT